MCLVYANFDSSRPVLGCEGKRVVVNVGGGILTTGLLNTYKFLAQIHDFSLDMRKSPDVKLIISGMRLHKTELLSQFVPAALLL